MHKLHLIIETPKGGELGHRLIASPGFENELEIARIAAAASKNMFGPDYFAVSRPTKQILSNGTIRNGTDTIILVGIDTGTLGFEWKRRVKDYLDQLFPKLDELLKDASWLAENRSTIVTRKELNDWVKSDLFRDVPLAPDKNPEPLEHPPINWRFWLYTLFATCLMLILLVVWKMLAKNPEVDPSPSKPNLKAQLKALGDDWKCTPNDVAISFVRVKNWNGNPPDNNHELQNSYVVDMLKLLEDKKGKARLEKARDEVIGEKDNKDFNDKMKKYMKDDETCKKFRINLYDIWKQFEDLKKKTEGFKEILPEAERDNVFIFLVDFPEKIKDFTRVNFTRDKLMKPKTPLVDRQDYLIYKFLKELPKFSDDEIKKSRKEMYDSARDEKKTRISDESIRMENSDKVYKAYEYFEKCLDNIKKL